MRPPHSIDVRLLALLGQCRDLLPEEQLADMAGLVRAGEPGIALENLATQLYEYDVSLERRLFDELASIGAAMGIDPTYWTQLQPAQ